MDVPEYGCNENINVKDDDSIVSEKCWKEIHRGDSRKWILRDGSRKKCDLPIISTMKDTYPFPFHEDKSYMGDRRTILLKTLYNEASEEIIRERNKPSPVEEYCTEYDGNYNINNTIQLAKSPNEEEENKELYEKYPLYASPAMSYWQYKIEVEKNEGFDVTLFGLSRSVDLKNPFKRNSGFTKPLSEVLDDCNL